MQHNPGFLAIVDAAKAQIRECTIADLQALKDSGKPHDLVDCREKEEYDRGYIPGARHLGKGVIERDIESTIPDRSSPIVLYCGGGYRSALAALNLQQMGYTGVLSMAGGIRAWREANLPLEGETP